MIKILRIASALALMLLLASGCALGPDYTRPEQDLPVGFHTSMATVAETSYGDLHWRKVYTEQKLQELIEEALGAAPDLLIAEARVREAEAMAGVTRSELYPQLNASFKTSPIARPEGKDFGSSFLGGAAVSWELDLWGRLRRADEAGRATLLATEENRRGLVTSMITNVASYYFQLAALHAKYEVAENTAANQRKALRLIERLSESGISSAAEVLQQEVALAVTESNLPQLRQQIAAAENSFSILLGRIPGSVSVDVKQNLEMVQIIPAGLPSQLLDRRPDIRAAEQQLVAANARVGEAKARFFPTLSLTGFFGGLSTSASDFLSGGTSTVVSLGADALQPLFAGKYYLFNYDAALARLDQAILGYRQTILRAMSEAATGLTGYQEAKIGEQVQRRRTESARESLRLAEMRYTSGVVSYIEVLDAQRQLFSAETALVDSLLNRHLALSSIYLALGGGWEEPNEGRGSDLGATAE